MHNTDQGDDTMANTEQKRIARKGEVPEADALGRQGIEAEAHIEPERAIALLGRARDRRLRARHYSRAYTEAEWAARQRAEQRGEHDIVEVRRGQMDADSEVRWLVVGVANKEAAGKMLVSWEFNTESCARAVAVTLNAMVLADVLSAITSEDLAADAA